MLLSENFPILNPKLIWFFSFMNKFTPKKNINIIEEATIQKFSNPKP